VRNAGYVPLDPTYPEERLAFMLEDAQVSVLLTQTNLLEQLPKSEAEAICLDKDWEANANCETSKSDQTTPENLAYLIYTSGSTGKPKGVQVPHKTVVNFLTSMREKPGLTDEDVLLSVTTLSFDIAVLELLLPLTVGATTVVVSRKTAMDGGELLKTLGISGATVMQATPATWRLLLAAGWEGSKQLKILCGGEALPHTLARELVNLAGSVWNMYGPTEATVWSTCYEIKSDVKSLIGQPIANTQIHLLDSYQQPVPIGVPGELYIGGAGVVRGYLNRPELTLERFIPDPFSQAARLYRTGDLARYQSDGNIEYLQRIDNQVKVRGFRIELGEIETMMAQHPAVEEAVVIVREDTPGEKTLVGYLVSRTLSEADAINQLIPQLRRFLKQKLPDYMVPNTFVTLDAMPLTPNGKVDRKALPVPDSSRPELEEIYVAPTTAIEQHIADIWAQVLNIKRVGIHDNFFELGGYSLLAIQIISRLRQALQVELSMLSLFELPTVAELAKRVETVHWVVQGLQAHQIDTMGDYEEGEL